MKKSSALFIPFAVLLPFVFLVSAQENLDQEQAVLNVSEETEVDAELEGVVVPVPNVEPILEVDPLPEPFPDLEPGLEPEPESEPELEPEQIPELEPIPDLEPEPEQGTEEEPVFETEPVINSDASNENEEIIPAISTSHETLNEEVDEVFLEDLPIESPVETEESADDPLNAEDQLDEGILPFETPPISKVFISEILPNPKVKDAENEFIEIYNAGDEPIDLTGWSLDDSKLEDEKFYTFEAIFLEPKAFLVLFRPTTGITLNNDEDSVYLFDVSGIVMDEYHFGSSKSGRSWGRSSSNIDEWLIFTSPSPGMENIVLNEPPVAVIVVQKDTRYMKLNVTGAESFDPDGDDITFNWEYGDETYNERENPLIYEYPTEGEKLLKLVVTDEFGLSSEAVITFTATKKQSTSSNSSALKAVIKYPFHKLINEFMPSPYGKDNENEWIELYNDSPRSINLSDWYLDDDEGASRPYKIPGGTTIKAGGYLVFYAPELKLSLRNSEDVVRLLDPNKNETERIFYNEVQDDWSFSKNPEGVFEWSKTPSLGKVNEFPAPPKAYIFGDLKFESVLPNPSGKDAGREAILLKNMTNEPINLLYWFISDLSSKKLFEEILIPAGESKKLKSKDFKLSLNNSNETLSVFDPYGTLIDEISWKKSASGRWLFNPNSLQNGMEVEVKKVVDGDTIVAIFDGKKIKIRLIGVDTPETVHPFKPVEYYGRQASNYLKNLLDGQLVTLNFDETKIDKYGRVLAYVYLDDLFVNAEIINLGYGYAYTRFPFEFLESFIDLEASAKNNRIGLWQNLILRKLIQDSIKEEPLEEELDELLSLELEEEEVEEELLDELELPVNEILEEVVAEVAELNCRSDDLKIASFMPNAEKGFSMEYVRLENIGEKLVCLSGWVLDDVLDAGSKPFSIRGGSIAPGGIRTFRKNETKLILNNSNDCVYLLDQSGVVKDYICYKKTYKNEVFTHAGGDWKPKPRTKKPRTTTKKSSIRYRFKRDAISYQSDLINQSYVGRVLEVDELEKRLKLELADSRIVTVSYASGDFDMSMAKQLVDFTEPVLVEVYASEEKIELVSLQHFSTKKISLNKETTFPFYWFLASGFFLLSVSWVIFRRYFAR